MYRRTVILPPLHILLSTIPPAPSLPDLHPPIYRCHARQKGRGRDGKGQSLAESIDLVLDNTRRIGLAVAARGIVTPGWDEDAPGVVAGDVAVDVRLTNDLISFHRADIEDEAVAQRTVYAVLVVKCRQQRWVQEGGFTQASGLARAQQAG